MRLNVVSSDRQTGTYGTRAGGVRRWGEVVGNPTGRGIEDPTIEHLVRPIPAVHPRHIRSTCNRLRKER